MSAATKLAERMSVRDFLAWESGDGRRYELVEGEPRAMAPPSPVHAILHGELGRLIGNHLRARGNACRVATGAGVIPPLFADHNFRVPDLAVTCSPVRPEQAALIDPVLLIEILSPSNQADTWSNVRTYTSFPSVLEILVLHSTRIGAEVLRRDAAGAWPEQPTQIRDGDLVLSSIGFRVALADLYEGAGLDA